MNLFNNPIQIAVFYFIAIFVFAIIYYFWFDAKPDSFILLKEFNIHPIKMIVGQIWKEENVIDEYLELYSLDKMYKELAEINDRESSLRGEHRKINSLQNRVRNKMDELRKKHEEEYVSNVAEFQNRKIEEWRNNFLKQLEKESDTISKARLKAEMDLDIAKLLHEISIEVDKDISKFTNTSVSLRLSKLYDLDRKLLKSKISIMEEFSKIGSDKYQKLVNWSDHRRKQIGILDFIYFSIGVSTTSALGDIIPNNRMLRFIISFQILISIVLVGLFINSIFNQILHNA